MPHRALDRLLAGVASLAVLALTGCLTITGPVAGPPGEGVEISETAAPSPPGEELADDSEEVAGPEEGEGAREDEDAEQDAQDGGESAPGWADVTARTSSGIVRLTAIGCDPEMRGTGSGFLIAPDLVVTAAHVVEGAMSTSVAVDGEVRDAVALGVDLDADVALLMLDAPVERGHLFEWPEFEVLPGSDVAALGFPLGGDLSITSGTLSAYEREGGREWVRISAPVNPGNSGGPVVDRTGEVVGIVSHRITESGGRQVDGVGYALSHVTARPLVEKWRGSPEHPATATSPSPMWPSPR
jgi:S1-C subfamily serine protease